jgi:intein/homing endonuclease
LGEPLGRRPDGKDLVLKFEITDVYPGDKYDDTAITELFFDGIDVHCVGKGTRILMNDHSLKNIEEIKAGDVVKSFDITRNNYVASTVKKVYKATHGELLKLKLENNAEIMVTEEHPFLTKDKSWCSHAPQKSLYNQWIVNEYEAGDSFAFHTDAESLNYVKLIEIEKINSPGTETYTLELESGNNFIGNGFIIREE